MFTKGLAFHETSDGGIALGCLGCVYLGGEEEGRPLEWRDK